jgi:hypothetical protein
MVINIVLSRAKYSYLLLGLYARCYKPLFYLLGIFYLVEINGRPFFLLEKPYAFGKFARLLLEIDGWYVAFVYGKLYLVSRIIYE